MAGIMVSASTGAMNSLLGKLTTLMGEEFAKLRNLRKEVTHISDELNSMKDALERLADVDELDIQTKRWRDAVREMSYDIEDIIDDFMLKIGEKNKKSGFVHKTIQRLRTSRARHQIAGRIEEIKKLVQETSARRDRYKLDIPTSSDVPIDQRVIAIYANADNLVGMEEPTNEIVDWIKDEEKMVKVVSIVGFGGLGKTTLANEVYKKLKGDFDCGAFVPVSLKPNIPKLLHNILSKVGSGQPFQDYELNDLIENIRQNLRNKRYLILIDDLWDVPAWRSIQYIFPENNLGSRLIITTRINDVAEECSRQSGNIFRMKPLSDEHSRNLFFDRIFGSEKACPSQLRDVSVEILKKCGGLPLAINSISSLLANESSSQKEWWEQVKNSLGSISGTNLTLDQMRQILNLSYKNLPRHLKTCFLYLGMYPEDYVIYKSQLVILWIAEGFVSKAQGQTVEQTGTSYFNELVNRSLIQPVYLHQDQSVQACKVHDMLLDLILHKSTEENFITVLHNPESTTVTGQRQKARRMLSHLVGATLQGDHMVSQVRSFAILGSSMNISSLTEFKYLRVFVADFTSIFSDDNQKIDLTGLSNLYHLRCLWIRGCRNCQLPANTRGLQKLEIFDIDNKSCIPADIFHVPRLLHLSVSGEGLNGRRWLPEGIGKMASLQYLRGFNILDNSLSSIKGLGELTNLNTLYLYTNRGEPVVHMDALSLSLGKLCSLKFLQIRSLMNCEQLIMSPTPPHLMTLDLSGFSRIPYWIGELHNLRTLVLQVSKLDKNGVDILGELPALINLVVRTEDIEEMLVICGTAFAVLKRFSLGCNMMSYLTFQAGVMPTLQSLDLILNARGRKQEDAAPTGIEHLLALDSIHVRIGCCGATETEERSAESVFRSAVNLHPGQPHVEIECGKDIWYAFY